MSHDCTSIDAKARAEMGYAPPVTMKQGLTILAASVNKEPEAHFSAAVTQGPDGR